MGYIEDAARNVLAISKKQQADAGLDPSDPNLHLCLMAGMLRGYGIRMETSSQMLPREQAEDLIEALYVILTDYELEQKVTDD